MSEITSPSGRVYQITFEDNFEGNSLDKTKWELCPQQRRQDIGGWWKDSMTEVHDGNLWLWAKLDGDTPVSGAIRTYGIFEQAYGYFECRMMFPRTTGFWAAFWMMCGQVGKVDGSAESGVEIDIIESGCCASGGVNHALHWDGYGDAHKSLSEVIHFPELYKGWHTYALEWTESEYIFYIDGKKTWRSHESGICRYPGYLKLSTEFGSWAKPLIPDELPDCARVDYVRVGK